MKKNLSLTTIWGFIIVTLGMSVAAQAESYRTFLDPLGNHVISLTLSQGKVIDDEVELNGVTLPAMKKVHFDEDGAIELVSNTGVILLKIPSKVVRTLWNTQNENQFTDGDVRVIQGHLIINGEPVNHLVEVFAAE